jgi:hypothetical protein
MNAKFFRLNWNIPLLVLSLFAAAHALPALPAEAPPAPPVLPAHAHNDYEHPRPLLDALDHGFSSVEADIHLVDGELLVAHDRHQVRPDRTLQSLYLDPLRDRARTFGGRVYPDGPPLILLIDIKSGAEETYVVLREVLREYSDILTTFHPDKTVTNAVTAIISGNRPRELMEREAVRHAAYDGRLPDLGSGISPHFMPLISDNWRNVFSWRGEGEMPPGERRHLRALVERTHEEGRVIRFWASPDLPSVWRELDAAGVDLINTDDLRGVRDFLLKKR